jgi:phosphoribosyl-ATP pyrophosphohydrolase
MIDQSLSYVIFMHCRTLEKAVTKMARPLDELDQTIAARAANPSDESYTSQLLAGGVAKVGAKVIEEAAEVVEAAAEPDEVGREHLIREAGDLMYHLLVLLRYRNCALADLEAELARRSGVSGLDEKASRKNSLNPEP